MNTLKKNRDNALIQLVLSSCNPIFSTVFLNQTKRYYFAHVPVYFALQLIYVQSSLYTQSMAVQTRGMVPSANLPWRCQWIQYLHKMPHFAPTLCRPENYVLLARSSAKNREKGAIYQNIKSTVACQQDYYNVRQVQITWLRFLLCNETWQGYENTEIGGRMFENSFRACTNILATMQE